MADVGCDRGQLVLAAALVLAATFIGLALVVNTVIFTENMATRKSVDTGDTVTYRHSAWDGSEGALHVANYGSDTATYSERSGNFTSDVSRWSNTTARYGATSAQSVEVLSWSRGTRISQDDPGEFRPRNWGIFGDVDVLNLDVTVDGDVENPHTSWAVGSDTTLREFQMNVSRTESLESYNETDMEDILDLERNETAFWVQIDDGGDPWRISLYDDTERPGNVSVIVDHGSTQSSPGECTAAAHDNETVQLDLTAGTITGADGPVGCDPLSFFEDIERYDIFYVNSDEVDGTYHFISDKETDAFKDDLMTLNADLFDVGSLSIEFSDVYYSPSADESPYFTTAIYDAELQVTYRTDELTYRTQVRLAPGEPGEEL